ncbi:MAG: SLC13/DASS family transporter [Planctomycetes bacterium]|nr:SLC13/DASS family transporter [Planctomycetota bacterium]
MTEEEHQPPSKIKRTALWLGPLCGLVLTYIMSLNDMSLDASLCGGITLWTALWWMLEPIPIPATSIIPLALFPIFGIISKGDVAASYGHHLVLLLLGGFILSKAMESSGAHRRLALGMINIFGKNSDKGVVFGFMLASCVLSMWISNTATTLMLLPIALAVVHQANNPRLTIAVLLGVAYAANIGGVGTPIGTPPNLIFIDQYNLSMDTLHGDNGVEHHIQFLSWMYYAIPLVIAVFPVIFLILTRGMTGRSEIVMPEQGAMRVYEKRVLFVFVCTALAWMTRNMDGHGWAHIYKLFAEGSDGIFYQLALSIKGAHDSSVALFAVVIMFLIPNGEGGKLLNWEQANKIPWGILLLFAGGIAIGKAFTITGISQAIGDQLTSLDVLPIILVMLVIALLVTFLTEVTSNTATTNILMPILAAVATAITTSGAEYNVHLVYMLPAVVSASCAFMLPVATAPNAVVYGSNKIPMQVMMKNGVIINIIAAFIVTGICYCTIILG